MLTTAMLIGILALSVPLGRKIYGQTRRKYLTSFLAVLFLTIIGLIISVIGTLFGFMFAEGHISSIFAILGQFGKDVLIAGVGALALRWMWDYFHTPTADELAKAQLKDPEIGNF